MGYTTTRRLFPVGLWVTLFVAAVALVVPGPFARIESVTAAVVSWPLQPWAWFHVGPEPSHDTVDQPRDQWTPLGDRMGAEAMDVPEAVAEDFAASPMACRVVGLAGRRAGRFTELVLDRSWDEVRGASPHVTSGGVLVGMLGRRGRGSARDDAPNDLARVLLLNHPDAQPVPAALVHATGRLRCIVEASRAGAVLPLQTEIWDDPYAAARLVGSGSLVLTEDLAAENEGSGPLAAEASHSSQNPGTLTDAGSVSGAKAWGGEARSWLPSGLPGGLVIGRLAVWGYEEGGRTLPIGLYVQPAREPFHMLAVAVWRRQDLQATGRPPSLLSLPSRGVMVPATLLRLPTPLGPCWLLVGEQSLPDGGALLVDGLFVGTTRALGGSRGLAVPLEQRRGAFSFTLWPDGGGAGRTFRAVVTSGRGLGAEAAAHGELNTRSPLQPLRVTATDGPRLDLAEGWLTTGVQTMDPSASRHAPPGLLVGRAVPVPGQPGALFVERLPHPDRGNAAADTDPEVVVYRFDPQVGGP